MISSSYLSKRFREQYQKSVVDYLYEVRIASSLPLLANPDLKIADVAQMTGFVDSNAFIRIFKKLKGITPGKYSQSVLTGIVSPENDPSNPS
ncbi:MAG: helix-turn-helix transcriptional regulator [Roseburia sp.]|nr:helix-turn-helix transcriptional regulator [Roseburia sp.]MCM1099705.1 helix-turn-helix transcriptional regulator [Ruminococcus flavefaciens]